MGPSRGLRWRRYCIRSSAPRGGPAPPPARAATRGASASGAGVPGDGSMPAIRRGAAAARAEEASSRDGPRTGERADAARRRDARNHDPRRRACARRTRARRRARPGRTNGASSSHFRRARDFVLNQCGRTRQPPTGTKTTPCTRTSCTCTPENAAAGQRVLRQGTRGRVMRGDIQRRRARLLRGACARFVVTDLDVIPPRRTFAAFRFSEEMVFGDQPPRPPARVERLRAQAACALP